MLKIAEHDSIPAILEIPNKLVFPLFRLQCQNSRVNSVRKTLWKVTCLLAFVLAARFIVGKPNLICVHDVHVTISEMSSYTNFEALGSKTSTNSPPSRGWRMLKFLAARISIRRCSCADNCTSCACRTKLYITHCWYLGTVLWARPLAPKYGVWRWRIQSVEKLSGTITLMDERLVHDFFPGGPELTKSIFIFKWNDREHRISCWGRTGPSKRRSALNRYMVLLWSCEDSWL